MVRHRLRDGLGRVRIVLELPVVIGRVGHHTGTGTATRVQVYRNARGPTD